MTQSPIEATEREALIRACALICMNGLIMEFEERALAAGYLYRNSPANHIELTRIMKLFGAQRPATTADKEILDRLTKARLIAKVSIEDWDRLVQITKIG